MLRACRYFGHTREYWWGHLTWPLYAELTQQLAEEPPADQLVAVYFAAHKWWSPPARSAGAAAAEAEGPEVWTSDLPDYTE